MQDVRARPSHGGQLVCCTTMAVASGPSSRPIECHANCIQPGLIAMRFPRHWTINVGPQRPNVHDERQAASHKILCRRNTPACTSAALPSKCKWRFVITATIPPPLSNLEKVSTAHAFNGTENRTYRMFSRLPLTQTSNA